MWMKTKLKRLVMEPWQFIFTLLLYNSIKEKIFTASYRLTATVVTCGEVMDCAFVFQSAHVRTSLHQHLDIYC